MHIVIWTLVTVFSTYSQFPITMNDKEACVTAMQQVDAKNKNNDNFFHPYSYCISSEGNVVTLNDVKKSKSDEEHGLRG